MFPLIILLCAASTAFAMPRLSKEACGQIKKIDTGSHLITIQAKRCPLSVRFSERTKFVKNGSFVTAASLSNETFACVIYRAPFFGPATASKVTLK